MALQRVISFPGRGKEIMNRSTDLPLLHRIWRVLPLFHQELSSKLPFFSILKMGCGHHVTFGKALGAGSS
jgi:hypothetical protein